MQFSINFLFKFMESEEIRMRILIRMRISSDCMIFENLYFARATQLSCGGIDILNNRLWQIVHRVCQWKNYSNWSIFGEDMNESLVARFLWLTGMLHVLHLLTNISLKGTDILNLSWNKNVQNKLKYVKYTRIMYVVRLDSSVLFPSLCFYFCVISVFLSGPCTVHVLLTPQHFLSANKDLFVQ